MPKRIQVKEHLSLEELEYRFKNTADPVERRNWQVLWLIARGKHTEQISDFLGITVHWVRQIVKRYNEQGPESMRDRRHDLPGPDTALLNDEQLQLLRETLQQPPPDGGLWSGPKVAAWMSDLLGRDIWPQRGWEYLKKNRPSMETSKTPTCQGQ